MPLIVEAEQCPRPSASCPGTSGPAEAGCAVVPCRRGRLARQLALGLQQLLLDPALPTDVAASALTQLARSPEPWARVDAARDPRCPPPVVAGLARDWWWEVRAAVASRPGLPSPLAFALARDRSEWVRRALAENADADPEALDLLRDDPSFGVRDAVAEHPRALARTLRAMVHDPAWEVRRSLAKRREVPTEVLEELRLDPEHWVRFFVACHPATPAWVRAELARDPRPSVRMVAERAGERARRMALTLGRGLEGPGAALPEGPASGPGPCGGDPPGGRRTRRP
ncbi:hypothetical protein [Aciditerrimonas ferrireducens]|uniref:hypothetical protein n=1 Tax=Aciditerrimonas ferrireducens TaxID=667306 RepID=UPI0020053DC4|nr:hypothetical protein [Aciditerrimonas ferrireducens]MCK4177802.1 hypothetical protein [Aciditerrimonas ferrireducens]